MPTDTTFEQYQAGGPGSNPNLIGEVTPITLTSGASNDGNDFIDFKQACPDHWVDWQNKWNDVLGGNTDPYANPDDDRYDNLDEYAFCMPPHSGVISPFRIVPGIDPAVLDGEFRRTAGGAKDVTYWLEYSPTLATDSWSAVKISVDPVIIGYDEDDNPIILYPNSYVHSNPGAPGTELVAIPNLGELTGLGGKGFVRIRVDLANPVDSSHTEVLGWAETALESGTSTYNKPFLTSPVFSGTVDDGTSGVSGHTLTFTNSAGPVDLATFIPDIPGVSYYLEVTSGDNEGQRFDVVSVSGSTVTLANDTNLYAAGPPFNTLTGDPPADLAGDTVIIRPHWTLDYIFPPGGFGASVDQSTANEVQVFVGGAWKIYWLYFNVADDPADPYDGLSYWVDAADGAMADRGATVIPPGQGIFFNNRFEAVILVSYGEVRSNKFIRPLALGQNLVGGGYPLDQSATGTNSRAMNLATFFFGSRDFKTADSFFIWKGDAAAGVTGYDTYYLLNNPTKVPPVKWVKVGDVLQASKDGVKLLLGDRSAMIRVNANHASYSIPCPWSP